ncbi:MULTISPECIES: LCP family protein [Streptosporangium]|nr:LCP family protein [Streptosporangium brasiliense]
MRLGQDSGDPAGDGGKRRTRRRGPGGEAQPGTGGAQDLPGAPAVGGPETGQAGQPERTAETSAQAGGPAPAREPAGQPGPVPAAGPPAPGQAPEGKGRPQFARPLTTASLIGWTLLSAVLPGAAHLRAGRRRTGYILLGVFGVLLVAALAGGLIMYGSGNTGFITRDGTLLAGALIAGLGALVWFLLVLSSYISLKPNRLNRSGQVVSGIAVGLLCVSVMAPFALAASTVLTVKETANSLFPTVKDDPTAAPIKHEDPWGGRDRVNFLLIGGDGAGNREGVRTDSMTVASVHVATGNTVMFSLPRNLQHVRFTPGTPLAKHFPNGFMRELPNGGLLNEVWQYGEDHPEIVPGKNEQRGPRALMDAIGHTLNLKIDYYALVNMFGFAHLVDAIGGLKIRVDTDVKWGGLYGTAGTIKAGYQTLSGEEALWYGRSRVGSDDFSRMARQRCVIGAFAQQATPQVVLTNFVKIANVAKRMAKTNIPRELLEHVTDLGLRVKNARITSLQFVPPEFYTGSPDWPKIRTAAAKALRQSLQPSRRALAAGVTASPGATTSPGETASPGESGASPAPTPSRTATVRPSQTPTQNGKGAKSLGELCGF